MRACVCEGGDCHLRSRERTRMGIATLRSRLDSAFVCAPSDAKNRTRCDVVAASSTPLSALQMHSVGRPAAAGSCTPAERNA